MLSVWRRSWSKVSYSFRKEAPGKLAAVRKYAAAEETQQSASTKESELEKFRNAQWWDKGGEYRPLHEMNPLRVSFIRNAALEHFGRRSAAPLWRPLAQRAVLDVGCGGGILSESLGRLGGDVTGIDVIPSNISAAQEHLKSDPELSERIKYQCISAEALVTEGRRYDLVVASEVVEHVQDPAAFIQTLSQLMDPQGLLFITTLNRTLVSLVGAIWVAEYVLGMVPRGTHDWNAFLTPEELSLAAQRAGLQLDALTGMRWNPVLQSWSFSSDTSINYAASFVRLKSDP